MKMAFCHDFVWIIILYIAFPKYVIFCWFFLQKILSALEDPKIWFWLKKKKFNLLIFGCSLLSGIMRTKDQSLLCKNSCIFVWFTRCTCVHKNMGTLVIVTHDDLCTNCSLNLLLFRCPKSAKKWEGLCGEFPSHPVAFC